MDTADKKGESWYSKLVANVTQQADQMELESEARESFRDFVMNVAKDQYKAGNNAGITWLRMQIRKEGQQAQAA